jgi:CYTH domain-containing protein
MKEIERKFLIPRIPEGLAGHPAAEIRQGYIVADKVREIRLRGRGGRFSLTVKQGAGLVRSEAEIELEERQFEKLWPLTEGRRVEKSRRRIDGGGGVTIELDVFRGGLSGLCVAEVEFPSEEEAAAFSPPDWFGREVTDDERFKNKSLARHGRPGVES